MRLGVAVPLYFTTSMRFAFALGTNATLVISKDGNCGGLTGQTCLGSSYGNCCSGNGYCGATTDYCNVKCQSSFGQCVANAASISSDGRCGATDSSGQICLGSSFGSCCSQVGWCGSTDVYCGTGCQEKFGQCKSTNTVVVSNTSQATGSATISSTTSSLTLSTTYVATSTAAPVTITPATSTMSVGAKAGLGVGVAAAAIAVIGGVVFLLRRRKAQKQVSDQLDEKVEAGSGSPTRSISSNISKGSLKGTNLVPVPPVAELGKQHDGRAELGGSVHGSASELDWKGGSSKVSELPTNHAHHHDGTSSLAINQEQGKTM